MFRTEYTISAKPLKLTKRIISPVSRTQNLGTKFTNFSNAHLLLDENSLFRNGPECLKKGIEAAVEAKELTPLSRLTLNSDEKKMAELEIVKNASTCYHKRW